MSIRGHFRLVDDFQATYIKFQGREPRTLEELAIARADYEHRRKLAEIRGAAKKLAQLDALLPALAERGISFSHRNISTYDGGKTLRLDTPMFTMHDDKLFAVLLDLGFREIERSSYGARSEYEQLTLKHGRSLLLKIDVTKRAAAPEAVATATKGAPC